MNVTGGVIYPIIFQQLLHRIGFPWTIRAQGLVAFAASGISLCCLLPTKSQKHGKIRHLVDWSAFRDKWFVAYTVGGVFLMMAYYVPFLYLPQFAATSLSKPVSTDFGFYLLPIINGASTIARLGAGWIAGKFGVVETFGACLVGATALLFGWIGIEKSSELIVWTVLWGLVTGIIVALPAAILPHLCPSPELLGTRMGMHWCVVAIGVLIGGPIGGALINSRGASLTWWPLQVFLGVSMGLAATLCSSPLIPLRRRSRSVSS
ncbi:MAG: hypothetical protein Q9159_004495 [Coniocarpon cinnabarinum]